MAAKTADCLELDVGGVGFQVHVPDPVHRRLVPQQDVTILTYCHMTEKSFQIYGFLHEDERSIFKQLLTVNGVGPKVALAVLSVLPVREFGLAVKNNDVNAFTRAAGVGKKMAQRLVLEMKTKLGEDAELSAIIGEPEDGDAVRDDVIDALLALGCTPGEAKKASAAARKRLGDDAADEDLVRAALQSIARI